MQIPTETACIPKYDRYHSLNFLLDIQFYFVINCLLMMCRLTCSQLAVCLLIGWRISEALFISLLSRNKYCWRIDMRWGRLYKVWTGRIFQNTWCICISCWVYCCWTGMGCSNLNTTFLVVFSYEYKGLTINNGKSVPETQIYNLNKLRTLPPRAWYYDTEYNAIDKFPRL